MANPRVPFLPVALTPLPMSSAVMTRLQSLRSTLPLNNLGFSADILLQLLLQGAASFPPPPSGGLLLCLLSEEQEWAFGGGLLLAAAQGAGLWGNTLTALTTHGTSTFADSGMGSLVKAAFPGERLAFEAQPGCHIVLVSSATTVTARGARTALTRAHELARSGTRTFLASMHCNTDEGGREFDAAVEGGGIDAVSRVEGAGVCAGWVVGGGE